MKHNKNIIDSMITITQQRDRYSLEFSLVATVAEMLPAKEITLFQILHGLNDTEIEKTVHLTITPGNEVSYRVDKSPGTEVMQPEYVECITNNEVCCRKVDEFRTQLLFPIYREEHPEGMLMVETEEDLSSYQYILEGMVKVYENYLAILHESEFDALTGLRNRRTFDRKIDALLKEQRSRESESDLEEERRHHSEVDSPWLAVIDIDFFKKINDNFGHVIGDEVLLLLAQKMKDSFRRNDILFRFGGEEFVIILEPVNKEMAAAVLERFRKTIEAFEFPQVGKVTISTGFSMIGNNDYPVTVLENADKALYHAKDNGRNCIHCYEELVEQGVFETVVTRDDVELF